ENGGNGALAPLHNSGQMGLQGRPVPVAQLFKKTLGGRNELPGFAHKIPTHPYQRQDRQQENAQRGKKSASTGTPQGIHQAAVQRMKGHGQHDRAEHGGKKRLGQKKKLIEDERKGAEE